MGDLAKQFTTLVSDHIPESIGIAIFLFCVFFEVSKIKVYPLRWLWKLLSWPFRKIDEQRTQSFKNLMITFKADFETKLENLKTTFNNNLTKMASEQNSNCTAVKACFTELEGRFDTLEADQRQTEEKLDKLAAARIKNHVLNFARQCRNNEKHSREAFVNLIHEHEYYESLVSKYQAMDEDHKKEWENNVYAHDYAYVMKVYDKCLETNDFLGG